MKLHINTILAAGALSALCSCEKDNPFYNGVDEGRLDAKALSVDYINRENAVRAADSSVDLGDFTINFVNTQTGEIARSFLYSNMPEVVALPVGNYRAEASYGDNPVAEWNAPYYLGNTTFDIEANKVTDTVDPITCKLSNIKVTIDFNDNGLNMFGDDAQVVVNAGQEGSLTFKKSEDNGAGYFRYVEGSTTLTAVFSGTVDGHFVESETKTYDNVADGNFYKISFTVHEAANNEDGNANANLNVDGTVTVIDQNEIVDPNDRDREYLTDDMRPVEGNDNNDNPDDPNNPDDPADNTPKVIAGEGGLKIAAINDANSLTACKFSVTSSHDAGFTAFTVDIESPSLTPEELATVGLASHLDLINPGDLAEPLSNLGFPINIGGWKEADFDITAFLGLLGALGDGTHKFVITVSDGNGTTTEWFSLKY